MTNETIGTLIIVVLKARHLRDKHSFYKQDPYAVISLNGVSKRTAPDIKGGQHPVWDEEIRVPIYHDSSEKHRILKLECWAKEPRVDDLLCEGKLDITETLTTGEFDDWIQLNEPTGGARGEIYLEMTYYAAGPPPVRRPSKLSPNDRLARPPPHLKHHPPPSSSSSSSSHSPSPAHPAHLQPHAPPSSSSSPAHSPSPARPPTSPKGTHLVPPSSSRSPSRSPPKNPNAPLPPLPEDPKSAPKPQAKYVPSILRPGNPKSRSSSPPAPVPPENPINAQYPSSAGGPGLAASIAASAYPPAPDPAYFAPQAPGSGFAFPMPLAGPVATPSYQDQYIRPPIAVSESELPDPYLQARYQTPLPLPFDNSTRNAFASGVRDESHLLTPKAYPQPPVHPDQQAHQRNDSQDKIAKELQRIAREEEDRRKRQEEEDEELAKALDRQLNSEEDDATRGRTGMPGEW